jgi:hypothetical protein
MRRDRRLDEEALTAVIEFLSAFVLFLVIVSAFLSLSRLSLGPNDPMIDRLDEHAYDGIMRLTTTEGWMTPYIEGIRNEENGTKNWHHANASQLLNSDVLPGLANSNGELDSERISALNNITETQLKNGLGFPNFASINLSISIVESPVIERIGTDLFIDGTPRSAAQNSAASFRILPMGNEIVEIRLEVHDAGIVPPIMKITEFVPYPETGEPEWVEIENEGGFAVDLNGWGLSRNGFLTLIGQGSLQGGGVLLLTGDSNSMEIGNSSLMIDIGHTGVLGRGIMDGLHNSEDNLRLTYNEPGFSLTQDIHVISYDSEWGFQQGFSAKLNEMGAWQTSEDTTPGES